MSHPLLWLRQQYSFHACGRRRQGSPLVIKAKAPDPCSAGVTPDSPAPIQSPACAGLLFMHRRLS
ncbi:hypothetical protein FA391_12765 [Pseudomonas aeruginosa]|nr:hypothetical protein [Pseudomonas aeruginosa]RQB74306.1 hypothetical protein IPC440_10985 [Pseudomonas aeruginosa]